MTTLDNTDSSIAPQTDDSDEHYASPLATAISLWRTGKRIDLTLFAELREEGFDVPTLERFYFNRNPR